MTRRRLLAAGTRRQWWPQVERITRAARQFGVVVREGVEQVELRVQMHREAKNWLILMDCFNAFSTVKLTAVLAVVATCMSALTPFVVKCYGEICAPVFFQMDSGERRKIDCSTGMQQEDAMRRAVFCMPLLPVLKRTREEFEPKVVEAFAFLDDISIGMVEVASDTVEVLPSLQRELTSIDIVIHPSEMVALKGHVPAMEQIALLEGIDVRISERSGVKVVGVPIDTDAYAMESAMEIVRNGGAEQFARMLLRVPGKQSINLIATGSMVQLTAYIERVSDGPRIIPACMSKGRQQARCGYWKTCLLSWASRRIVALRGRVPDESVDAVALPTRAGESVHGSWTVWAVVGRSTEDVSMRRDMVSTVPEVLV